MEYVERLLNQTEYLKVISELEFAEADRAYCKHGLSHSLDTARIMWIMCLESNLALPKEAVYLTALLHDVGRLNQYKFKIPHEEGSILLAELLLKEIGYDAAAVQDILQAIHGHRGKHFVDHVKADLTAAGDAAVLSWILQEADRLSRNCFSCTSSGRCNWEEDKKNKSIVI